MTQNKRGFLEGLFGSPQQEETAAASGRSSRPSTDTGGNRGFPRRDAAPGFEQGRAGHSTEGTPEEFAEALSSRAYPEFF